MSEIFIQTKYNLFNIKRRVYVFPFSPKIIMIHLR